MVTGGSGMLGSDVLPLLEEEFDVLAPSHEKLDVTDAKAVEEAVQSGFDIVLHMAALTDLDWCEDHPEEAMRVNTGGTQNVAKACAKAGCKMIYISTSGVFSGRLGRPYTEDDTPKPANVYGRSKYEGELAVERFVAPERRLILRVGWLFGGGRKDKKFVAKMFKLMRSTPKVMAVDDIWGSPNYSVDIGRLLVELIDAQAFGLFHVANSGEPASRYDVALAIRDAAGFDVEVEAVPASRFPTRAPRPPMEAITSLRLDGVVKSGMRHWRNALEEYVARLKKLF